MSRYFNASNNAGTNQNAGNFDYQRRSTLPSSASASRYRQVESNQSSGGGEEYGSGLRYGSSNSRYALEEELRLRVRSAREQGFPSGVSEGSVWTSRSSRSSPPPPPSHELALYRGNSSQHSRRAEHEEDYQPEWTKNNNGSNNKNRGHGEREKLPNPHYRERQQQQQAPIVMVLPQPQLQNMMNNILPLSQSRNPFGMQSQQPMQVILGNYPSLNPNIFNNNMSDQPFERNAQRSNFRNARGSGRGSGRDNSRVAPNRSPLKFNRPNDFSSRKRGFPSTSKPDNWQNRKKMRTEEGGGGGGGRVARVNISKLNKSPLKGNSKKFEKRAAYFKSKKEEIAKKKEEEKKSTPSASSTSSTPKASKDKTEKAKPLTSTPPKIPNEPLKLRQVTNDEKEEKLGEDLIEEEIGEEDIEEENKKKEASVSIKDMKTEGDDEVMIIEEIQNSTAKSGENNQVGSGVKKIRHKFDDISPELFVCKVCQKIMNSGVTFEEHLKGKPHLSLMKIVERRFQMRAEVLSFESKLSEEELRVEFERKKSNVSASLGPRGEKFCKTCAIDKLINWNTHKQSIQHRTLKEFLHPSCYVCKVHFVTRMDWLRHSFSVPHLRSLDGLRLKGGDVSEELRPSADSLYAVQLELSVGEKLPEFVGVRNSKGGPEPTEEQLSDFLQRYGELDQEPNEDDIKLPKDFSDENSECFGEEFVVSVSGYACRICRVYLSNQEEAEAHCKSKVHYLAYRAYLKKLIMIKARSAEAQKNNEKKEGNESTTVLDKHSESENQKELQNEENGENKDEEKMDFDTNNQEIEEDNNEELNEEKGIEGEGLDHNTGVNDASANTNPVEIIQIDDESSEVVLIPNNDESSVTKPNTLNEEEKEAEEDLQVVENLIEAQTIKEVLQKEKSINSNEENEAIKEAENLAQESETNQEAIVPEDGNNLNEIETMGKEGMDSKNAGNLDAEVETMSEVVELDKDAEAEEEEAEILGEDEILEEDGVNEEFTPENIEEINEDILNMTDEFEKETDAQIDESKSENGQNNEDNIEKNEEESMEVVESKNGDEVGDTREEEEDEDSKNGDEIATRAPVSPVKTPRGIARRGTFPLRGLTTRAAGRGSATTPSARGKSSTSVVRGSPNVALCSRGRGSAAKRSPRGAKR